MLSQTKSQRLPEAANSNEIELQPTTPAPDRVAGTSHNIGNGDQRRMNGVGRSSAKVLQQSHRLQDYVFPDVARQTLAGEHHTSSSLAPTVRFDSSSSLGDPNRDSRKPKRGGERDIQFALETSLIASSIPETTSETVVGQQNNDATPELRALETRREPPVIGFGQGGTLYRAATWDEKDTESRGHQRQASFFEKIKALASSSNPSSHVRGPGNPAGSGPASPYDLRSPRSEHSDTDYFREPIEAIDIEDDAEDESDGNEVQQQVRPKRKSRVKKPAFVDQDSHPNTPRQSRLTSFIRDHPLSGTSRPAPPLRRHTDNDLDDSARMGVSEDEGRDRLRNAWRRGLEGARGMSHVGRRQNDDGDGTDTPRRPMNLRRLTGSRNFEMPSSPFRLRADRQSSSSAQKWKQVKAGLKMLGQKKRDERVRVDHQKSAQLMAELLAGGPAAVILASMYQRDEHGHRKVPVLLELLKIRIPHSEVRKDSSGDRHQVFQVDLEYGSGPARLKWSIRRSLQDFAALHAKYKAQSTADKFRHLRGEDKTKPKMPRFPRSAFPYARNVRGLFATLGEGDEDEDEEQEVPEPLDMAETAESNGLDRSKMHKRRKSSFAPPTRTSTGEIPTNDPDALTTRQREMYSERQRRKLETYLQQMIRWLIFRADSTRLCKFLEVSALAFRLSAEGGFQGKQGLLTIASRANREVRRRRAFNPGAFKERHKPRWFLVRHSYVVCVDGPESTVPYEVFLVDSDFRIDKHQGSISDQKVAADNGSMVVDTSVPRSKTHMIRLYNAERKLKLIARNERQHIQFQESLSHMMENTVWAKKQRFNSFAPVRNSVWARWLVDGRDHMWQVSRAIDNAKDFVYIHDWWLSPELYMRRPAAISQKWRLDRLLQRKAQEGVKIFIIVYRNIESAIPIDSEYTKWSLLDLHENICVQRSPNQFRQNQFFWAHHEKLVVVDNMMAFVGGVDLCFGRWDDPCHTLTDDKLTGFELDSDVPRDCEHCQIWPGKDYSNPRVQDFYALDRPYEEMYDRTKVPRMPWHDISMQIVGQPARDIGRHFVQRWNYILRSRIPSRPTPVLLPPPEFEQEELDRLGMTGTCQVQILRSCAPWSIGTPSKVEHSIMTAYCHLIEHSDHFVYIENQFYISSCMVEGTQIHNKIGDAIVERAIRAWENGDKWRAVLVIPLMPGFQNSVDSQDGTSVRLIMQCQFRSICRGETSIFGRLRAKGINPENYVRFYSLRQWGKIGPRKCLTTEQLYIHAKCMVVDDRSVIIGSANINERSMLGSRDSEVAAVVTDTQLISSTMGGDPYEVGEFAHTLRKRLMREHLGIDVDAIFRREQGFVDRREQDHAMDRIYRDSTDIEYVDHFATPPHSPYDPTSFTRQSYAPPPAVKATLHDRNRNWDDSAAMHELDVVGEQRPRSGSGYGNQMERLHDLDVEGYGHDNMKAVQDAGDVGLTDSYIDGSGHEILLRRDAPAGRRIRQQQSEFADDRRREEDETRETLNLPPRPPWPTDRGDTYNLGLPPRSQLPELPPLDDTDIGGPPLQAAPASTGAKGSDARQAFVTNRPVVTEDCMRDPLDDAFLDRIWHQVAENNTKLYRQVFRCMPDSEVLDWKAYERFNEYNDRFMQSQGLGSSKPAVVKGAPAKSGPPGAQGGTGGIGAAIVGEASAREPKSRGFFGGLLGKSRSKSELRAEEGQQGREMDEKSRPQMSSSSPDQPQSASSSTPTTAVSTEGERVEEKADLVPKQTDWHGMSGSPGDPGNLDSTQERSLAQDGLDGLRSRVMSMSMTNNPNHAPETTATQSNSGVNGVQHNANRRKRANTKNEGRQPVEEVMSREQAEELLNLVQGSLVLWPYDWLEKEERGGNWLYSIDQIAPLEIYD